LTTMTPLPLISTAISGVGAVGVTVVAYAIAGPAGEERPSRSGRSSHRQGYRLYVVKLNGAWTEVPLTSKILTISQPTALSSIAVRGLEPDGVIVVAYCANV
jgi:hypothetical protein